MTEARRLMRGLFVGRWTEAGVACVGVIVGRLNVTVGWKC